ncbi:unnamed protein product [Sphagnum jensenii]|uniref:F-box domain-containing protein n=1 Tax=Sphagnum jensenii TaxID=128206 RepID=A0ABP1BE03_9BRYO
MDGERWNKLPEDLLKKVFTSLSLVSIAKARTVCRNWHALVQNSDFFQLRKHFSLRCSALEHHWSLLLLWEPDQRLVFSYNVASRKWERRFSLLLSSVPLLQEASFPPVAGAFGLFCFASREFLLVCNFLTMELRRLPLLESFKPTYTTWILAHLLVDTDRLSYKIIIGCNDNAHLGHRIRNFRLEVYDSRSNLWRRKRSPPPPLGVSLKGSVGINSQSLRGRGTTSQVVNGILYCLDNEWRYVMTFHVQIGAWIGTPFELPEGIRSPWFPPCLMEHRDHLWVIGAQEAYDEARSRRIVLYKLELKRRQWNQMLELQREQVSEELFSAPYVSSCFLQDDIICFVTKDAGLLYSLCDGSLQILPSSPHDEKCSLIYLSHSSIGPIWNIAP